MNKESSPDKKYFEDQTKFKEKLEPETALERFAATVIAKNIEGLRAEFVLLDSFRTTNDAISSFIEHEDCNRHKDIVCYDRTRVILRDGLPLETDYIHANYVKSQLCKLKTTYICTQCPMNNTVNDFWRMVAQEKPKIVVMLCKNIKNGATDCAQYCPLEWGQSKQYGNIRVQYMKKISSITEKINNNGIPKSRMGMLRILRKIPDHPNSRTIIHCCDGVGMSGTMIACKISLKILLEGKNLDVMDVIREIRSQRACAVRTEAQYIYLHKTLCEYISAKKILRRPIFDFIKLCEAYHANVI